MAHLLLEEVVVFGVPVAARWPPRSPPRVGTIRCGMPLPLLTARVARRHRHAAATAAAIAAATAAIATAIAAAAAAIIATAAAAARCTPQCGERARRRVWLRSVPQREGACRRLRGLVRVRVRVRFRARVRLRVPQLEACWRRRTRGGGEAAGGGDKEKSGKAWRRGGV